MKSVGSIIKTARKNKRLTQIQLSDRTGISQSYLAQIENDQRLPSHDAAQKIASELDINFSELKNAILLSKLNTTVAKSGSTTMIDPKFFDENGEVTVEDPENNDFYLAFDRSKFSKSDLQKLKRLQQHNISIKDIFMAGIKAALNKKNQS